MMKGKPESLSSVPGEEQELTDWFDRNGEITFDELDDMIASELEQESILVSK